MGPSSTTTTNLPAFASSQATLRPAMPAPTTTTSAVISCRNGGNSRTSAVADQRDGGAAVCDFIVSSPRKGDGKPVRQITFHTRQDPVFQRCSSLLMPLSGERLVKGLPLALKPDRAAGKAFLPQRIDGDNVVAARCLARLRVGKGSGIDRLRRQPRDRVLVVAAIHAIDAIAANAGLGIGIPAQVTLLPFFPGK